MHEHRFSFAIDYVNNRLSYVKSATDEEIFSMPFHAVDEINDLIEILKRDERFKEQWRNVDYMDTIEDKGFGDDDIYCSLETQCIRHRMRQVHKILDELIPQWD